MAAYSAIKAIIDGLIFANSSQLITGTIHNNALDQVIDVVGANRVFINPAITDNPGTPDMPVVYFALPGVYTNFGALEVTAPIGILLWSGGSGGSWSVTQLPFATGYDTLSAKLTTARDLGLPYTTLPINQMVGRTAISGQWIQLIDRRTGDVEQVQLAAAMAAVDSSLTITSRVFQKAMPVGASIEVAPRINMMWHTFVGVGDGVHAYINCPLDWLLPVKSTANALIYEEVCDIRHNGMTPLYAATPTNDFEYSVHSSLRYRFTFSRVQTSSDKFRIKWWGPRVLEITI